MKKYLAVLAAFAVVVIVAVSPTAAYADARTGKLLLVLDSSGSMAEPAGDGHTKIANAKSALNDVVDSLDQQAQVGMRVYGATVFDKSQPGACTDSQLVVPIGPAGDKKALKSAIAKYTPYGETPIAYALRQAGKDLGGSGQRTIVLVSDGEGTCNENPCDVAKELAATGIDLRIDVIGLDVSGKARDQLKCVAASGKGNYTDADNLSQLKKQLNTAKQRALHPFQVTGTPVKGSADQLSAPTITNGRWTDRLSSRGKTTFYKLHKTMAGSTFWLGVSAELDVAGTLTNGVDVKLATEGGKTCGNSFPYAIGGSGATTGLMFGLAVSRDQSPRPDCLSGDLILALTQRSNNQTDLGGTPVQLDVYEEPPVADASALPAKAGNPVWTPMVMGSSTKIKGGASLAGAPGLKNDATYAFDITPGETQIFSVDADWGQRIQVLAEVGAVSGSGGAFDTAQLDLLGPYGGNAFTAFTEKMPAGRALVPSTGAAAAVTSPEIRYRNTDVSYLVPAALPGRYSIVLSYPKRKGHKLPAMPVLIKASVLGTAGTGAPTYVEDGSTPPPNTTPSPSASTPQPSAPSTPTETAGPADSSEGSTPWGLVAGLVACAVLLGGVGIVAVRLLRKG